MKQKLVAYLMRDNGQVLATPTDELVVALDQLMQASTAQVQRMSSDIVAGHEFLQTVKLAMRTSKSAGSNLHDVASIGPVLRRNPLIGKSRL